MALSVRTADSSTLRLLDALAIVWLVLWLALGVASGWTLWNLSDLGDTVTSSGHAIDSAGRALQQLGGVPVIGDQPAQLGKEAVTTAADISARGQEVKSELRLLAVLLGLAIVVMPTTPVLGFYLPLRLERRRTVATLRRSLSQRGDDPGLDRHLAEQALVTMSYADACAVVDGDPREAVEAGRTRALADAELARLGVDRPR